MKTLDLPAPDLAADLRDARRAAFVAAARTAFFDHGYAGTTMSAIAATVGGSKTTLWTCFRSKQELFAAVLDDIVERYGQALAVDMPPGAPVALTLERFAAAMMTTILSPPIVALHRLVTGEAGRFPELAAMFYERGAKRGKARLAAFIEGAMADGRLRRGDAALAARQFTSMCQAGCFQQSVLALGGAPSPDTVANDITAAIDSFVRAWGPNKSCCTTSNQNG